MKVVGSHGGREWSESIDLRKESVVFVRILIATDSHGMPVYLPTLIPETSTIHGSENQGMSVTRRPMDLL